MIERWINVREIVGRSLREMMKSSTQQESIQRQCRIEIVGVEHLQEGFGALPDGAELTDGGVSESTLEGSNIHSLSK